jgi:hypothetical protein
MTREDNLANAVLDYSMQLIYMSTSNCATLTSGLNVIPHTFAKEQNKIIKQTPGRPKDQDAN